MLCMRTITLCCEETFVSHSKTSTPGFPVRGSVCLYGKGLNW